MEPEVPATLAPAATVADLPDAAVARVLAFLPLADLRAAEAVCRHWAHVAHDARVWAAAAVACRGALGPFLGADPVLLAGQPARDYAPSPRALCKRAAALACMPRATSSLLAEALFASSTDQPEEALSNVLTRDTRNPTWTRYCYWSSGGSETADAMDSVTFRLATPVSTVHKVQIRPFRAYFQFGQPVYAPLRARVLLGAVSEDAGGYGGGGAAPAEDTFRASYASPYFDVAHADALQTLTLPQPALCVGGVLRVELLGRAQTQASDGRYYVCLVRARALGTPWYGWTAAPEGGGLVFDAGCALARRVPRAVATEADDASVGSDHSDEEEEDEHDAAAAVAHLDFDGADFE